MAPWSNMKHSSITALPEAPRSVQLSQVYPFHLPPPSLQKMGLYLSVMAHPATRWASSGFKVQWEIHHPQSGGEGETATSLCVVIAQCCLLKGSAEAPSLR